MELPDVSRNYDSAARYYDVATDLIFHRLLGLRRWRRRMVDRLGDIAGATALDVGCGTGNNFPLLEPRIGPEGRIVAVDYSRGMLEQARRRCDRAGWTNVTLIRDDAARLGEVSGPVDAAVSAWCLGIVHDLPAALERMVELVRPGGRIAIMDFHRSRPDHGPLRWLYPVYGRLLVAASIDSPEDLSDARLRARWDAGRRYLSEHLDDYREDRYLYGAGLLVSGTKPAAGAA